MARKTIERHIAFDDKKGLFYVTMDYGKDSGGKRVFRSEKKNENKSDFGYIYITNVEWMRK